MKTQHTQGPWKIEYKSANDSNFIRTESGIGIAVVYTYGAYQETKANAKLIAAAPEMHEALVLALETMQSWATGVEYPVIKTIKDVLKKANPNADQITDLRTPGPIKWKL